MKSIIPHDPTYCYIHRRFMGVDVSAQHLHHCLHGYGRRKLADMDGLTVNLCLACHNRLHDRGIYDLELEQIAQRVWMEYNKKTAKDFIARYGKNYI